MKVTRKFIVSLIREEIARVIETRSDIDPDAISFHDVINDEGPEHDAWDLWNASGEDDGRDDAPVQHKRPSVLRKAAEFSRSKV